jgi:hypothetical protein
MSRPGATVSQQRAWRRKVLESFNQFADAKRADKEYYQSLTPNERLDMLLELIDQNAPRNPDGTREGFRRVGRILKRSELKDSD